jgi:hypothetical protein
MRGAPRLLQARGLGILLSAMIERRAKKPSPERPSIPSISTGNAMWKVECDRLASEGTAFRVVDVSKAEHIAFVSKFAATRNLSLTVEGRTFLLEPRQTGLWIRR